MALERITAADFDGIGSGNNIVQNEGIRDDMKYTTTQNEPQGYIEGFLQHGAENATTTETLLRLTGYSRRELMKAVEDERRKGTLILTKPKGGYFLPSPGEAGRQEIQTFYNIQSAKALSLLKTISTARRALRILDGQMEL